ncbi:MAG: DNA repair protein RadA [candidate division Zixibacteria bacterium HGW-Zixibacteria-1]|nr:MAG: DNA repair protein RadA [candidate division Zixibacteria bacterium HGW-Zixibacteria-1]
MDKKTKTAYVCTKCGAIHPKWQGQCRDCGEWNSLAEERIVKSNRKPKKVSAERPRTFAEIDDNNMSGYKSGMGEFDRVLGGALLPGSAVLLAGEPGIGKSTLILQAANAYSNNGCHILYVTGEESPGQIKKRAERLNVAGKNISIANLTDLEQILTILDEEQYNIVIVDSIQTVTSSLFDSPPGTIGQIRESAGRLIEAAKREGFALFLIGHVTKEGLVAGPKILEHMVDAVLYFEGESRYLYRILRTVKNRYGATFELGVFEMAVEGLRQVDNPSLLFLSDYEGISRSGTVVAASCEGNRPILVEIQALVSSASYGTPQRVAGGIDNKRLALLLAILEKRVGVPMGGNDVFVSVAGGLRLNEPAIDLAVLAAIVSSLRDIPVDTDLVMAGEVGLSGEVRAVSMVDRRVAEAAKLGFKKIIIPAHGAESITNKKIEILTVSTLDRALELLF